MIIKLGPIVIMDSKTREAYANLARAAYEVHQIIWYDESMHGIREADAKLSEAISHTPPEDIV